MKFTQAVGYHQQSSCKAAFQQWLTLIFVHLLRLSSFDEMKNKDWSRKFIWNPSVKFRLSCLPTRKRTHTPRQAWSIYMRDLIASGDWYDKDSGCILSRDELCDIINFLAANWCMFPFIAGFLYFWLSRVFFSLFCTTCTIL